MTPADLKQARLSLHLSVEQCAALLETDAQTIRRMERGTDAVTHRPPANRMLRLLQAYMDGWRPSDWPSSQL